MKTSTKVQRLDNKLIDLRKELQKAKKEVKKIQTKLDNVSKKYMIECEKEFKEQEN